MLTTTETTPQHIAADEEHEDLAWCLASAPVEN